MRNKNVFTRSLLVIIGLNVFIAILLSQFAAAAAEPVSTATTISKFNLKDDPNFSAYKQMFQIPTSQIASITNNGGKFSTYTLDKAIDGNLDTTWITGWSNSSTLKNEVVFTFTDVVDMNRIAYVIQDAPPYYKMGFPKQFEIYGNTEGSDNYTLVASGTSNTTGDMVEFKFAKTSFKKLKFVFVAADQDWASASEFWFFKEDTVLDATQALFTDRSHSKLVGSANIDQIHALEAQAASHPFKTTILHDLDDAKKLLDNPKVFDPYTSTLVQKVSPMIKAGLFPETNTYQPTGLYALPGQTIRVYVEATDGGKLPKIVFTQNQGHWSLFEKEYDLSPGLNTFTAPLISDDTWQTKVKKGGPIYFENYFSNAEQPVAPRIRVEGASSFPLFKEGGDEQAFIQELKDYNAKLDADNAAGTEQVLDIAELNSTNMLLTTTTKMALDAYVNQGIKPSATTSFYNEYVMAEATLAGMDGSLPIHDATNFHTNIRVMQQYAGGYAAGNHIGFSLDQAAGMLDPAYVKTGWGYAHELGHQMDRGAQGIREWREVTNNVESAAMKYHYASPTNPAFTTDMAIAKMLDRTQYEKTIYPNVAPATRLIPYEAEGLDSQLGLFWQLQLYDQTYWPKISKLYRERTPSLSSAAANDPTLKEQEKRDLFIKYSSEVLNLNLGEYFKRHGWNASDAVLTEITKYPTPKKIWYINDSVVGYTGDATSANVTPNLKGVSNPLSSKVDLSFNVDPKFANDVLGYEIVKGNQVVAFTRTNAFTEVNNDIANNGKYTVNVYDKKLNVLGSKSIDISNNSIVYLSDINWVSATTGWSTIKKDKSIDGNALTALNNDVKTTYTKGVGTHANSTIIYDLTNIKGAYFESYVAVDQEKGLGGSVIFEVWADGVKVFNSGIMKGGTNAQFVKVPIQGVKELKLVATDAGDGNAADHADWLDAKITFVKDATVSFDSGAGSAVASANVKVGSLLTAPADPTRAGYTFDGWYKEAAYATPWNFAADTLAANTTLYAKWTVNTYTVTFDTYGGSAVQNQTVAYNEKAMKPTDPTKTGYTFGGWYKEAGLVNAFDFANTSITDNITLFAKWSWSAPANVVTTVVGSTSIKISWDAVSGATGYEVSRSTSSTGAFSYIGSTTNLNYTNSGLASEKIYSYYYKVVAYKIEGNRKTYSRNSEIVHVQQP